jgi:hypothetical protein
MTSTVETDVRRWPLRLMALVLLALGLVPMANLVAPGEGLAWWAQSVRLWILWSLLVAAVALVVARFARSATASLPTLYSWLVLRPSRTAFLALVTTAVCAGATWFAWRLFHLQPVTIDELSLQWQARLLASGRLVARAEPHPEFFSTTQTLTLGGRWFTHFPLGAFVPLGAGVALGVPWLVNPVLAALGAVAIYRFLAETTTELEARSVVLLYALSPFVLFMAASQLDHVAALVAIWTAVAALPAWVRSTSAAHARRSALLVGGALGAAATIRPYDAALSALAIGAFQLAAVRRDRRLASSLAVQVAAGCVPVLLLLLANRATTGSPFEFAYDALNGPAHRPGFHVDPMGDTHTPRRGIYNVSAYLMRLDLVLLGWPVPGLLLVVAALAWRRRATRWDVLVLAVLGALLVGYWAFWGEGRALGPRFLFSGAPVFLLWAARFPGVLRDRLDRPVLRGAATLLVPIWLAIGWLLPGAAAQPSGVWAVANRARERSPATELVAAAVAERGLTHALVLVDDGWRARLVSRLQALGARPFAAQKMVDRYDACLLQQLLDSADALGARDVVGASGDVATRDAGRARDSLVARTVFATIDRSDRAPPVPGLAPADQIALAPGRPLTPSCARELVRARSFGVDYARFLPRDRFDADGRLAGPVVYARDLGPRDTLLASRFGDRAWYVARVAPVGGALRATVEPLPH